jgi:ubiquitin-protein ligase
MEQEQIVLLANCTYTGSNCIIPEYIQNSALVELLLNNACYALSTKRASNIFEPVPQTWKNAGITPDKAIDVLEINTNYENIIETIQSSNSDEQLISKIGENTYGFIKFVLSSCISSNNAVNISKCTLIPNTSIHENNINQYKFNYTNAQEDIFNKEKTVYLYHGSPYENWYSIMRAGIKIGSKDKKIFLNGAVYGDGIYLSNDINVSLGYTYRTSDSSSSNSKNKYMLAIYEVIDNPKWKKTENIFVIDDEKALILRYIIVLNNCTLPPAITTHINSKLNSGELKKYIMEKEKATEVALSKAYTKRLMIEYKKLIKQPTETLGFTMKLATEDNLRVWQLFIHKIDNPKIENQMAKLNIPYIEMEFTFPETYPFEPPFIRIVYPRFKPQTGHITSGGSLCMEAISKDGWAPTTNVEAIITQIKFNISQGDAVIDDCNYNKRYDMETAREAFARAMAVHKDDWLHNGST